MEIGTGKKATGITRENKKYVTDSYKKSVKELQRNSKNNIN